MPTPPLSDELATEAAAAYRSAGNKVTAAAARTLGIPYDTLKSRVKVASTRGLLKDVPAAMPGYRLAQVTTLANGQQSVQQKPEHGEVWEVPKGMRLQGVTALTDPDGRIMHMHQMARLAPGGPSVEDVVSTLKEAFADYKPAANPVPRPAAVRDDLLTLLPCNDWHIGMFGWNKEVSVDWDLKIAEKTIGEAVENVMVRSTPSGECIVLGGGDLLHADNSENKTAKSGNVLQVDGRYQKVVGVATQLMVRTVDACLRRHGHVTVRILPGNHDEHSAVAVAYFMAAWFRNEPRVTVDLDPSLFFWFRFGNVLLGATHGHTVKAKEMASIMAHRRAKDWGETQHRFIHCFHVHHREVLATEGKGVITEVHQAPIPQDAWHFGAGFLSGRSIQAITYHKRLGWYGGAVEPIQDAEVASAS